MNINIVIFCPECGEELVQEIMLINAHTPEVNVVQFEQTNWECFECGKNWAIGSIDIEHREKLLD